MQRFWIYTLVAVALGQFDRQGQAQSTNPSAWPYVVDWNQNRRTHVFDYNALRPSANGPSEQTCAGVAAQITLSGYDGCGEPLSFIQVTDPGHGVLGTMTPINDSSASVTYTPTPGFTGTDTFTYKVNDGLRDSSAATATIHVGDRYIRPLWSYQFPVTWTNQPVAITLTAYSPLGCTNTFGYTVNTNGLIHGTLTGTGTNRVYTPATNFVGMDVFTYAVNDGVWTNSPATVTIFVVTGPQLTAQGTNGANILVSWSLTNQTELTQWLTPVFELYRSTVPGTFTTNDLIFSDGSQQSYLDYDVVPGSTCYYAVRFTVEDFYTGIHYTSPFSNVTAVTNGCSGSTDEQALWVNYGATPQQMAQWLMGTNPVTVSNVKYTGAPVARGIFGNGSAVGLPTNAPGLPFNQGVILSTGPITNAIGPNDDSGYFTISSALNQPGDADLDGLLMSSTTVDAAALEFDLVATNSFSLQFQYFFASEAYPEWIHRYDNDPMAIFITTNRTGTNWIITTNNNIALVPGTNLPVSVSTINGGYTNVTSGLSIPATNPQYYVDNGDPLNSTNAPVFNIQYDGATVLLTAQ